MTDLSYIEDLENRATILQEMFEEDSDSYKQFISLINDFKNKYESFGERVERLEDTVYTLVNMLKQGSERDSRFLQELESATINDSVTLRDDGIVPTMRAFPN